ncbi:ArsR/SmtB family transcription factor [Longimycelium tulufanense]|uniref:ArsR/SmtB family transcription factor n=1 Tax=Longimycelium tulufanense TaxID=907463 RepID=UPI0016629AD0
MTELSSADGSAPTAHPNASPSAGPTADEELFAVFRALANPTRMRILEWLRDPRDFPPQDHDPAEVGVCVKHIQDRAGIGQSTTSQYLGMLQRAGLVIPTRNGKWTYYRRNEARIRLFLARLAVQLAALPRVEEQPRRSA